MRIPGEGACETAQSRQKIDDLLSELVQGRVHASHIVHLMTSRALIFFHGR